MIGAMDSDPFWKDAARRKRVVKWLLLGFGGVALAGLLVAGGLVAALLNLRRAAQTRQKFAAIPQRPPSCSGLAVSQSQWQDLEFQYPADWSLEADKADPARLTLRPKQSTYANARWTVAFSEQAGDPAALDAGSKPWSVDGRALKPGRPAFVQDKEGHDFFTYARQDVAGREAVLQLARRYSFWRTSAYDQWTLWIRSGPGYRAVAGPMVERSDEALDSHLRDEHCPFWVVANSLRPKS
jgi:hypothetical protein